MSLKKVTIKSHEIVWARPPIILGQGRLGKVYKVQYRGKDVAIKSSTVSNAMYLVHNLSIMAKNKIYLLIHRMI